LHCDGRLLASTASKTASTRSAWRTAAAGRQILQARALVGRCHPRRTCLHSGTRRARNPVVAPLQFAAGRTLHEFEGFRFALYPRRPGRAPELDDPETLEWMGASLLASMPSARSSLSFTGPRSTSRASARSPCAFCWQAISSRPTSNRHTAAGGRRAGPGARLLCPRRNGGADTPARRLPSGNVLWTQDGPHFVDFDDCRMGPALQDIWMLLSATAPARTCNCCNVMEGYREFCDFNAADCTCWKRCAPCA